jgi:hypothetical protein
MESACSKAWDEYGGLMPDWDDYFSAFLLNDLFENFNECIERNGLPAEYFVFGDDDDDYFGAVSAKSLSKQKSLSKFQF